MKTVKKSKLLVSVLILVCALLLTLAACKKDEGSGIPQQDSNPASSKEDVTLIFNIWDTNQKKGMEDMAAAFTAKYPNIKIKVEITPWDQYWTKLESTAMAKNMPDIFWMHPEQVYTYVDGQSLMDITDRISSAGIDMTKFPEFVTGDFNIDDRQYAIPKDYSTIGLWYNKDLFDAAGVAYPDDKWTWDDWSAAAEKLTNKEKGIYGMLAPNDGQNYWYNIIWQNGGDLVADQGKKATFDDPKTVEAIEFALSFIEKGYAPTSADLANTKADQYFESGKAAMITSGSWMIGEYLSIEGLNADVAPLPMGTQRGSVCAGMGYAASANTKYPEQAWLFLEFLAGEEANLIQAKSGAAIPALEGTQQPWVEGFSAVNAQIYVDASEYGNTSYNVESRTSWTDILKDYTVPMFALETKPSEVIPKMNAEIQAAMDEFYKNK